MSNLNPLSFWPARRKKHKSPAPQRHEDHKEKEKLFLVLFVVHILSGPSATLSCAETV